VTKKELQDQIDELQERVETLEDELLALALRQPIIVQPNPLPVQPPPGSPYPTAPWQPRYPTITWRNTGGEGAADAMPEAKPCNVEINPGVVVDEEQLATSDPDAIARNEKLASGAVTTRWDGRYDGWDREGG